MQTAYLYDEQTKEYKSEVNAQLDPLESEKAGQDIYLLPANATWLKPTPKDGYASVWRVNLGICWKTTVSKNIGCQGTNTARLHAR